MKEQPTNLTKLFGYVLLLTLSSLLYTCQNASESTQGPFFQITISEDLASQAFDGRLLLMLSNNEEAEPRFQIADGPQTQLIFGADVENWAPGQAQTIDASAFGYPIESLSEAPAGEYYVQALLHKYETFKRSDGHTVKLPMDRGEGQHWNQAPGNVYNQPVKIAFDPGQKQSFSITIDQEIPPIAKPEDTKYVKHIQIESKLLSEFWGRPMHLGAHVLLPEGFDEHPEVKYPLAIMHGHFPRDFGGFRTEPPDKTVPCEYSSRFNVDCYNHIVQQENYDLANILKRDWKTLGPKLKGKIHIYCGDMDNYYLNNAVYLAEDILEATSEPYYDGEVDYGDRAEHCWNGDHSQPNHISRLRYHRMFIPKWAESVRRLAPKGADLRSWRY